MTQLGERIEALSPRKRDLLLRYLVAAAPESEDRPIPAVGRESNRFPLSFAQQRLWFLQQLDPHSAAYNLNGGLRLDGPLKIPCLVRSLNELVRRHEALRTTFVAEDGEPVQAVAPEMVLEAPVVDLGELPRGLQERELRRLARAAAARPFDLARGPLLRVGLLRLGPDRHALLLAMHHIVSDAWSMGVLFRELGVLYESYARGNASPLAELKIQYPDFAVWQRQWLRGETWERQLSYWRQRLDGAPELHLPTDHPRPPSPSLAGDAVSVVLPRVLTQELKALAQRRGTTLFITLLTAFKALLLEYSGQTDLLVGIPVANRSRSELEGLVGFFVNTLVLRTDASGDPSFLELLDRVSRNALEAYDHQDLPFEQLVEELQPDRDLSRQPLFQVMFQLQTAPLSTPRMAELAVSPLEMGGGAAALDLTFSFVEAAGELSGHLVSRTDLFARSTALRTAQHFQRLVQAVVQDPEKRLSEVTLLSEAERHQLVVEVNDSSGGYPESACVHELFEDQAERRADAPAVELGGLRVTYGELNRRANQLARHLRFHGVAPEALVGICLRRSLDMVVGLLGILKAGGAYLPLDPSYPRERLKFMLEDAGVSLLLTQRELLSGLPEHAARRVLLDADGSRIAQNEGQNLTRWARPENLAYVIYTSGSTGEPKGAMLAHRGIVNQLCWRQSRYRLGAGDAVLQAASLSFDVSVWDIFGPLIAGARLVLPDTDEPPDGAQVLRLIREHRVTTMQLGPSRLLALLDEPGLEHGGRLRCLITGGEVLSVDLQNRLLASFTSGLHNLYGPTEASIDVSHWSCTRDGHERTVPIGRPIANQRVYLLDADLRPVPMGRTGELLVGGVGVARGYLHRPRLTAERFIPDPFGEPGGRLYRTGDLARFRSDGTLEFEGRLDNQVKVRGLRIELEEIEAVLAGHAEVARAVVVSRGNRLNDANLVAYLIPRGQAVPVAEDLRAYLKARLPEYMVPRAFVALERLPLTENGKVDRRALPDPPQMHGEVDGVYAAPRSELEQLIAALWKELLGLDALGVHDNFFDLGGHSLLATQVVSRLRDAWGVELPVRSLFEAPTVAGIAERVEAARRAGLGVTAPPIRPAPRDGHEPCAFAQRRLWFLDQLHPGSAAYNIPAVLRSSGRLDVALLERCFSEIVRRHEILRTTFVGGDDGPAQVIHPPARLSLPLIDLGALPPERRAEAALGLAAREARRPFDLSRGPLLRVALFDLGEQEQILFLNLHHIVCDGWSTGVLIGELIALYQAFAAGRPSPLSELPVQYADFARWQRDWFRGGVLGEQLAYWKRSLAGLPALALPTDRPRPPVESYRGARRSRVLPAELWQGVTRLSRLCKVTHFMILQAALGVLLRCYTGQSKVVVGSPISNRNRAEIEGLIGFFVNTLVLVTDLTDAPSFRQLLVRVREVALEAYAHQDLPFEKLVEELQPDRDMSVHPLFQVMLALQNLPIPELKLPGVALRPVAFETGLTKFDLIVSVAEFAGSVKIVLEYNRDLFDGTTADRLLGHLQAVLEGAVRDPDRPIDRLSLLGSAERHQLMIEWNDSSTEPSQGRLVHEQFEERAERWPDLAAVEQSGLSLTYGELDSRSNRLAHFLRGLGVRPDCVVALCIERSLEFVVSMLAILKAGGAYLPLDPSLPKERLRWMLEDAGAEVLVTRGGAQGWWLGHDVKVVHLDAVEGAISGERDEAGASRARPENLAYVIYTSGSTGRPKAVMATHRSLCNLVGEERRRFAARPGDAVLPLASPSFDASVWEMWMALASGAALIVGTAGQLFPGPELVDLLERRGVTHLTLTPSVLAALPLRPLPALRTLIVAGEACPPELPRTWGHGRRFFNAYGPTEITVCATMGECRGDEARPSIGRPIANVRAHVLDAGLSPLPIGAAGELYVGGEGVARGYLNRPALTAERFLPDPYGGTPGSRLYRTGDRARFLPDGRLEFLGRLDAQVKVRGYRVELGEIEAVLARHPGVAESVVVVRGSPRDVALAAYWVPRADPAPTGEELRRFLRQHLPGYMVPAVFVRLEALPLTTSGKVDHGALPDPTPDRQDPQAAAVAPRSGAEEAIAAVWREVLGLEDVGVRDNFFDRGGHSLRMVQVHRRLLELAPGLTLLELFEYPTIESLAAHLGRQGAGSANPPPVGERDLAAMRQGRARLREQAGRRGSAQRARRTT